MMDHRHYAALPTPSDSTLYQILQEAHHRWLRPAEVCEILHNYRKFKLTADPPHKPQSGSLFLFDRKALRYFRKDGHNWRKKKDGKTVREAHERLKAGSVEVLHCYYAHGEDNENFQRRSYWMLETNEHIVLVHYREVKEGNRSGMRSPNSYLSDGSTSLGNTIATSSAQTSPLVSPRASSSNTSIIWNGLMCSPECESSDDTDQSSRLQEYKPSLSQVLNGVAGMAATKPGSLQPRASFSTTNQNGAGYEEMRTAPLNDVHCATTLHKAVSELSTAQGILSNNGAVVPPGGFDLLEWCELMKYGRQLSGNGSYKFADSEVIESASWADVTQHTAQQPQDRGESTLPAFFRHKDLKMVMSEALSSIQGLAGPSDPIIDGHLPTDVPAFGGLESLRVSSEMLSDITRKFHPDNLDNLGAAQIAEKQDSDVVQWGVVLEELAGNGRGQHSTYGEFESDFSKESLQPQLQFPHSSHQDEQPISAQHGLARFDAANNNSSEVQPYSNVFKDFQADTPSQSEEHDAFKKLDSFGRWMSEEIGRDAENSLLAASDSGTYWASALEDQSTLEASSLTQQMQLDIGLIPLLSHEQCFSIMEFSPDNAFSATETKVLVTGIFQDTVKDPSQYQWCCMFGEVEVPAQLVQPGVMKCQAPPHAPGRVPFYITRNDRVACSDVREFEYHTEPKVSPNDNSIEGQTVGHLNKRDMLFQIRLARMLSSENYGTSTSESLRLDESRGSNAQLNLLTCYEEWEEMEYQLTESGHLSQSFKEKFIQKLLKEKLQTWLLAKVLRGGKQASVLDDNGLGVLHIGAALGYTWIIAPTLEAGVNINFRDSRGWTALHWAAQCGREEMVVALLAAGADPGAKTDPSKKFPAGQTPADLASIERHKGIAGYLAESSLTSHLSSLTLRIGMIGKSTPLMGDRAIETVSERTIVQASVAESKDQLTLQDSLAALRNATQAAARIHSAFRADSFQKRQESLRIQEDEYGISNEQARYIVAAQKAHKSTLSYGGDQVSQVAAIRIQQTYRGWKGRKNFLLFRQHVVKIQAHVRGHQVRKQYRKIVWSVGIVEKAILRWRRRGRGLRGFSADGSAKDKAKDENSKGDGDDDFLKAGRKQTEAGLEAALARVQSMARSPEAREQYRRLVEIYPKEKVHYEGDAFFTSQTTENKEHPRYSEDFSMLITDQ